MNFTWPRFGQGAGEVLGSIPGQVCMGLVDLFKLFTIRVGSLVGVAVGACSCGCCASQRMGCIVMVDVLYQGSSGACASNGCTGILV